MIVAITIQGHVSTQIIPGQSPRAQRKDPGWRFGISNVKFKRHAARVIAARGSWLGQA